MHRGTAGREDNSKSKPNFIDVFKRNTGSLSQYQYLTMFVAYQVSLELDPSDSAQLEICNNAMISSLHDCVEEMNKLEFSAGTQALF